MHQSRAGYSPTTAKILLEMINRHKDDGAKVALVNTDLTAAYDIKHKKTLKVLGI